MRSSLYKLVHSALIPIFITGILTPVICNEIKPSCPLEEKICEFHLTLGQRQMMMYMTPTSEYTSTEQESIFHANGSVSVRDNRFCGRSTPLSAEEATKIPTGDGSYKMAYLFNDTLPGPALVVYEGQQVVVHVTNELINEGTTVHWHGIKQHNTPWMDGVGGVTQCPINPGEVFTYRFIADAAGTFWYHTHLGTQRTMGAYGPLVVLDRSISNQNKKRGKDPLPRMDKEFYMIVSDWFEVNSRHIAQLTKYESVSYAYGWHRPVTECFNSTKQSDGVDCGVIPFQSGVINGKGYHYSSSTGKPTNPGLPLEHFVVFIGQKYRFRVINAAMTFAFRVSIDGHMLNVIATDGNDVVTKQVESFIISGGERYDFWIEVTNPQKLGNYWIRAETLEMYQNEQSIQPSHVEAVLHYEWKKDVNPVSERIPCTQKRKCLILNCPYKSYLPYLNRTCVPVTELRSTDDQIKPFTPQRNRTDKKSNNTFVEHFLNFHFTGTGHSWKTTVNGILNVMFSSPPQLYPDSGMLNVVPCDNSTCQNNLCECTHILEVPLDAVVQLVLLITVKNPNGTINGNPHNVHLHGYNFQVLKTGYPVYDKETGFYKERNRDIECFGEFCNHATWANESWTGGNVPEIIQNGAPLKDTVFIPVGGYKVVQFKASNPGYWYMHCHTEFHNEAGMALLLKVGEESQMTPAPHDMNKCGDFDWTSEEFEALMANLPSADPEELDDGTCPQLSVYRKVRTILAITTLVLIILNTILYCKTRQLKHGYTFIASF